MKRTFVETSFFSRRVDAADPSALLQIQAEILRDPAAGAVIPGTGGLRKIRIADTGRGKGKRGGYRVIYLDMPKVARTHLLALYDKDEKGDISNDEKRIMRTIAERIKKEAR